MNPKAAQLKQNSTLYDSPSLSISSGTVLSADQYVIVYAAAYDENGQLKSYLVSSNFAKAHREWIEPSALTFISGNYGQIQFSPRDSCSRL